jgi:translocation and assembly module TamB
VKRRVYISAVSVLVILVSSLAFVFYTESGLRWVLKKAEKNIPGSLSFNTLSGCLAGPLELKGLSYRDDSFGLSVNTVSLDWEPLQLLSLTFYLADFKASGVTVETTESSASSKEDEGIPDIRLPLGITVDNLLIRDLSLVEKDTSSPLTIKEIMLKADMSKTEVTIDRLSVITSESAFTLGGTVRLDAFYTMNLETQWHIMSKGYAETSGRGMLTGDLNLLKVSLKVNDPFTAGLEADVLDVLRNMKWKANLSIDELALQSLNSSWPETDITGTAYSSGRVTSFDVKGSIAMYVKEYGKFSSDFSIAKDNDTWFIQHAQFSAPETKALVQVSGQYVEADEKASFQVEGKWEDIAWPLSAHNPDLISPKGTFRIKGTPDVYDFFLSADINGKQFPPGHIDLSGKGTQEQVILKPVSVDILEGNLTGQGTITWKPSLKWQASFNGQSLNPGVYRPEWPGRLDMKVQAEGSASNIRVDGSSVQGVLRGYPFQAKAEFTMGDNLYSLPVFELTSGSAHLSASGSYSGKWDGQWSITVPDLEELIEGGKGEIYGEGNVEGENKLPEVKTQLKGSGLSLRSYQAGTLKLDAKIDVSDRDPSHMNMSAEKLFINSREIQSLDLKAEGKLSTHSLSFSASSPQISIRLSADAGLKNELWQGSLNGGEVDLPDFGTWTLIKPAEFSLSETAARTGNLCLGRDRSSACLQTEWIEKEGLSGHSTLSEIPLSLLNTVISPDVSLEGAINGKAEMSYTKNNLYGQIAIDVPDGKMSYKTKRQESFSVHFEEAGISASLVRDGLDLNVDLPLKERGYVQGSLHLPQFSPLQDLKKEQLISGTILADFNALDILPLFASGIEDTTGLIRADLTMAGTLGLPEVTGQVSLHEGSAQIPDLGIHASDINLDVKARQNRALTVDGRFTSGKGTARIEGNVFLNDAGTVQAYLSLQGESVEVVRVPQLHILTSPDIEVKIHDRDIDVEGTVSVPEAAIEPPDLSGAVPVSKDVYVMSESSLKKSEEDWRINSRLQLILGKNVSFRGYGLSSRITGSIHVTEEPGKATRAKGELELIDGIYKAYGQELTIKKGRFLFVDLIDDPGLDVEAVRQIKDILAGVQVSGTLKDPHMRVFSVPSMDQGDALSYLLLGRPMNELSRSQGGQLQNAALSAGLSGGGLLAQKIGATFGLEDVDIEQGETVEESSLIIGKYLSPNLYVSYGIGLFEPINTIRMRYNLSRRWLLQTEYGIESGGDILYKIER